MATQSPRQRLLALRERVAELERELHESRSLLSQKREEYQRAIAATAECRTHLAQEDA